MRHHYGRSMRRIHAMVVFAAALLFVSWAPGNATASASPVDATGDAIHAASVQHLTAVDARASDAQQLARAKKPTERRPGPNASGAADHPARVGATWAFLHGTDAEQWRADGSSRALPIRGPPAL